MSIGIGVVSQSGAGTLTTNASSAAIIPSAINVGVVSGDLVILVAYVTGADCTLCTDLGDGWKVLDSVYDAGTGFGGILAIMVAGRGGNHSGILKGISLPGNGAWTCQTYCLFISNGVSSHLHGKWDIDNAVGSRKGITATASSTTINVPDISPGANQWLDIMGGGYNNAGTTTTIGTLTPSGSGYPAIGELIDTGQISPPHGIFMDTRSANVPLIACNQWTAAVTGTLAVAKTNLVGLRASVPVIGNMTAGVARGRMRIGRRFG